jgi:glucuronate isomerase
MISTSFLLENESSERLYHEYAANLPIIDFHCHLSPAELSQNRRYADLGELWLEGDHYKWRAMRANGVDERYITGDTPSREKFQHWAETVPYTLRNPLYHWTHLELARYFGTDDILLNGDTAQEAWDRANARITRESHRCRGLVTQMNVEVICTTDDPADPLEHHAALRDDAAFGTTVLPTWRPDKAMTIEDSAAYNAYLDRLSTASNTSIRKFDDLIDALRIRQNLFHEHGCRLSDHGLECFYNFNYTAHDIEHTFENVRSGVAPDPIELYQFKSAVLHELAVMNAEKNWTQQFHVGAVRNQNSRQFDALGPDTGYDSMGESPIAEDLGRFMDILHQKDQLTRTIVYNNNPRDNAAVATMLGNFQEGPAPGKMQFGSAWWHLDQKDGIEQQLNDLSNYGMLRRFVGMVTDSRSFLSFPRHEYFRRILCNMLGNDMERGLLPNDFDLMGELVQDVCYRNAKSYFGF